MDEAQARFILAGERADRLVEVVRSAWKSHIAEKRVRSDRTRANIVWDYMVENADTLIEPLPGVERRIVRYLPGPDWPLYIFDGHLGVRFKKHTGNALTTANHQSAQQDRVAAQGQLDGVFTGTIVSCGYKLDLAQADIERVVVTKWINDLREWYIDLEELAAGMTQPAAPVLPLPDTGTGGISLPGIVMPGHEGEEQADEPGAPKG